MKLTDWRSECTSISATVSLNQSRFTTGGAACHGLASGQVDGTCDKVECGCLSVTFPTAHFNLRS